MKQGTNAAIMRRNNEKTILSLINTNPISRADIAKRTGLTRAAVTIIIEELINKGYIIETPSDQTTVGRQPMLLSFNGESIYSIGINITRTGVFAGISDMNGKVLVEEHFKFRDPEEFFSSIKEIVDKQIQMTGIDLHKIYGVGVVSPGPVDAADQKIINPPNFNAWHNVAVAERLKDCLGFDILFENVSNASALAEMYFGPAKAIDNFMALLVDEGIGSGIVQQHRLFGGVNELGHISICHDGIACECGNRGCLEKYAAIPMILKGTGLHAWKDVIDSDNREIMEKEAEYLSTAVTSASNLFHLDMLVLCGDLGYCPDIMIDLISNLVNQRRLYHKELIVRAGQVISKSLIASSIVIHDFFLK